MLGQWVSLHEAGRTVTYVVYTAFGKTNISLMCRCCFWVNCSQPKATPMYLPDVLLVHACHGNLKALKHGVDSSRHTINSGSGKSHWQT